MWRKKVPQSQETFKCDGWLFCIKRVVGMAAVLWMSAELAYWFEPTVSGNWVVICIPFPLSSFGKEKYLAKNHTHMKHNGNSAAGLQRCQILDLPPEGLASSRGAGANSYQCDQLSYAQDKVIDEVMEKKR